MSHTNSTSKGASYSAQNKFANKKILIIHDRFMFRGGAERLILIMARGLGADIATGFWSEQESFPKKEVPHKLYVLGKPSQKSGWRYLKFQWLFYFKTKFIKNYDLVIFSGNNCLSAAHHVRPGVKKVFYCHTPVRHAYDLRNYYLSRMPWWKRLFFRPLTYLSKLVYNYGFRQMDIVIANSKNVQQRIKQYLKTDSTVIYPPIQTNKFKWLGQQDYYLSFARVDKLKRVGDIVRAFQQMPDKKLIVCSGGDDLVNIKRLAHNYKNIEIKGWVGDDELRQLVGNCIATLYIPLDEDFGMTPLESMSAGKPCIGVNEGGLKETILDGQTGKFIPADYSLDDIIQAVNWLTPQRALAMRQACEQQAAKFSADRFIQQLKAII